MIAKRSTDLPQLAMLSGCDAACARGEPADVHRKLLLRQSHRFIPTRKNRKVQYDYDKAAYKRRNIIERIFCRFKDWRRIATRFDRNIQIFMAAVALAATVIWWL